MQPYVPLHEVNDTRKPSNLETEKKPVKMWAEIGLETVTLHNHCAILVMLVVYVFANQRGKILRDFYKLVDVFKLLR